MTHRTLALGLVLALQQGTQTPKPTEIFLYTNTPSSEMILTAKGTMVVSSPSSGRVEVLSDAEYASLQKLRQAVADEEKRIALAHGVVMDDPGKFASCQYSDMGKCILFNNDFVPGHDGDRYEYRGQFLLVNVPIALSK